MQLLGVECSKLRIMYWDIISNCVNLHTCASVMHNQLFNLESRQKLHVGKYSERQNPLHTLTVCFQPNPSYQHAEVSCLSKIRFKFWCRHTEERVRCVRLLLFTWRSRPTCKQGHNHCNDTVFCNSWFRLQHAKVILIAHTYVYAPISSMIHGQAT